MKKKYTAPTIETISAQSVLERLGPAVATYGRAWVRVS